MPGHRVVADLDLFATEHGGLKVPIKEGDRSLLFVFPALDDEPIRHGGVIEQLDGQGCPGGRVTAHVWFWEDSAELVAPTGAQFELWYGRTVGRGVVKDVLPDP